MGDRAEKAQSGVTVRPAAPMACYAFDLANVKLLPGPFRDNMVRDLDYLSSFDCDRLLAPFEKAAGPPAPAPNLGGWESEGLASHCCGHFMSASVMMYSHTRDKRLLEKVDYLLPRLAECQKANGRDDPDFAGYCAGIPRRQGGIQARSGGRYRCRQSSRSVQLQPERPLANAVTAFDGAVIRI